MSAMSAVLSLPLFLPPPFFFFFPGTLLSRISFSSNIGQHFWYSISSFWIDLNRRLLMKKQTNQYVFSFHFFRSLQMEIQSPVPLPTNSIRIHEKWTCVDRKKPKYEIEARESNDAPFNPAIVNSSCTFFQSADCEPF